MAQKQIIWSAHAKKSLYTVLERLLKGQDDKDVVLKFFRALTKKMDSILKKPDGVMSTDGKDVYGLTFNNYLLLFENRETGLIIHSVSENIVAGTSADTDL